MIFFLFSIKIRKIKNQSKFRKIKKQKTKTKDQQKFRKT